MNLKGINITTVFIVFLLNINFAVGNTIQDEIITAAVEMELSKEPDINVRKIIVGTKDNIVSLSGELDTELQINRVIEVAYSVNNVKDVVVSGLKVKNSNVPLTDTLITAKVKGRILNLFLNKKIAKGYDLHVETTNQVVHIHGIVKDKNDIDIIKNAVSVITGVKQVHTNIELK